MSSYNSFCETFWKITLKKEQKNKIIKKKKGIVQRIDKTIATPPKTNDTKKKVEKFWLNFVFLICSGYLEGFRAAFDGLGYGNLDDLEWTKFRKNLICYFWKTIANPPKVNETIKQHDKKKEEKIIYIKDIQDLRSYSEAKLKEPKVKTSNSLITFFVFIVY